MTITQAPFWKHKSFAEMTREEWESLCDGCGKCCLHKLEDEDEGTIYYTDVACRFLDHKTCRCEKYMERRRYVPNCAVLTPKNIGVIEWMPASCAYRMLAEGKDLAPWHPLVSGKAGSMHDAGMTVAGRVVCERDAGDFEDHLVNWPNDDSPEKA